MEISASFLSIKDNLGENINKLARTNIDYIHVDIMDGRFVANQTENIEEIKKIINNTKPLDIHLMVEDVISYVDLFKELKPKFITFHLETNENIMETIKYIKDLDIKVGLAIKPDTIVEKLIPFIPFVDMILVMSVNPGYGGQKFIASSQNKIEQLKQLRDGYKYLIEVDGGINDITVTKVLNADIIVVGSFLTNGNYEENLKKLKEKIYG